VRFRRLAVAVTAVAVAVAVRGAGCFYVAGLVRLARRVQVAAQLLLRDHRFELLGVGHCAVVCRSSDAAGVRAGAEGRYTGRTEQK